jgi:hypothetical protein
MKDWLVVVRVLGKKERYRLNGGSYGDVLDYLELLYGGDYDMVSCVEFNKK